MAARLFSTKDGETVLVTEHHVAYIYNWLNKIYKKLGYDEYSEFFKAGEEQTEDAEFDVMDDIRNYCENKRSFIINMLTNPRITAIEIRDFAGSGKESGDKLRTKLVSSGMIIKKAGFYVKSKQFRQLLKEELK